MQGSSRELGAQSEPAPTPFASLPSQLVGWQRVLSRTCEQRLRRLGGGFLGRLSLVHNHAANGKGRGQAGWGRFRGGRQRGGLSMCGLVQRSDPLAKGWSDEGS